MNKHHRAVLSNNHEFLVSEIPVDDTLEAIKEKQILTWHDFDQLRTLRHQGRRALARYLLAVLPTRGAKAFDCFLEALQEANAQHIVDLLLEQKLKNTTLDREEDNKNGAPVTETPADTPLPSESPDPHEYAVKLSRNMRLIREFVNPADVSPVLSQNKVMTPREADMAHHLHGKNKKWDLIMAVLLQRGERAFQAFMAALLQKDYTTIFHTIQETSTEPSDSEDESDDSSSDGSENNDVIFESDEEIKAETAKTSQNAPEYAIQDQHISKADETLLQGSRDLQDVPRRDMAMSSEADNVTDDLTMPISPGNDDTTGYYGFDTNNTNNKNMKSDKINRAQRRKSIASAALNSVKEEPEV